MSKVFAMRIAKEFVTFATNPQIMKQAGNLHLQALENGY
jgi:hypothetical protein